MTEKLLTPLKLGPIELAHRVVMAPLTRMRAHWRDGAPTAMNADYYAQRATPGGLLIAEASPVSQQATGHPNVPGIHSAAQVAGWKLVTDAVRAKGGHMFLQLWHTGRVSHSTHQALGKPPVAPSAVAASGTAMTAFFKRVPYETPRALRADEIPVVVESFRRAAMNAMEVGFAGVEIHGANGYLLEQFLYSKTNHRTDAYGGSIENRSRLTLEIADAVAGAVGAERTGIRLSPYGVANDSAEAEPMPLFTYLIGELARRRLAYLHLIEPRASGTGQAEVFREDQPSTAAIFRAAWPTVMIDAGGYTREGAIAAVADGRADAVAFGRFFISNPDLVRRIAENRAFTKYDRATFYGGAEKGYTDYPAL
jgi:N-ethylmaleimide reductase